MHRLLKRKPRRLELIFERFDPPLYFITFNTHQRQRILANSQLHHAFVTYCQRAADFSVAVGRYVIMPDHVHLFICIGANSAIGLNRWVKGLKRQLEPVLSGQGYRPFGAVNQKMSSFWQPGFFDHLLRSNESYEEKWEYVRQNPVRAGLVTDPHDWPHAGEIILIDRV